MDAQRTHSKEMSALQQSLVEERVRKESAEESLRLLQQQSVDVAISMEEQNGSDDTGENSESECVAVILCDSTRNLLP